MTEQESNYVHEFYVAGVKFHELHTVIKEVEKGEILMMEPEPTNKYDSNAIKILRNGVIVGYVPAKLAASVLASMEVSSVTCVVTGIVPSAKPWEQLKVGIEEAYDA